MPPHPPTSTPPPDRRPDVPGPHGESAVPGASGADGPSVPHGVSSRVGPAETRPAALAPGGSGYDSGAGSGAGAGAGAGSESGCSSPESGSGSEPGSGSESGWSPRLVRLGAPRPGSAAPRRARWFGVPLVPPLVAALAATAFLVAGGGSPAAGGRPGGDQAGAPSPVGTPSADATSAEPRGSESGTAGPGADDTPAPGATTGGGTPTRTEGPSVSAAPDGSVSSTPPRPGTTAPSPRSSGPAIGDGDSTRSVSFESLRVGDCFDIDRDAPGTALPRRCDTPHNAELVARLRLTGVYATDSAILDAATLLCREPLRRKAARQPAGTRWTTFVQYPYRTSYLFGSDTVACSLAASSATGGEISHRLQ
ncbi:hypothetical protein [Streptomyces exfoliatus]|uniref:hypothetical protein n=1 Tax=Streptomyces exfoliatus TaxID=1905 RepID=UPI003C300F52